LTTESGLNQFLNFRKIETGKIRWLVQWATRLKLTGEEWTTP